MASFFSREKIMPEVVQPYGPYEDVRGQLDQVYDQAQNRSSQKINQLYANIGANPRGAQATSARARATTDIENQRAQTGYQSYYDWLRGKQLATPQVLPSGASTLASPFISGIGQAAGPGIVNAATKGMGSAWDWMTSPSASASANYGSPSGNWGEPTNAGDMSSAYQNVPYDYSNIPGVGYDAYGGVSGLDWSEPSSTLFNVGAWGF